jgi:hypothetical protein
MSSAETVGFDGLNRLSHIYVSPKSKMEETVLVFSKVKTLHFTYKKTFASRYFFSKPPINRIIYNALVRLLVIFSMQ